VLRFKLVVLPDGVWADPINCETGKTCVGNSCQCQVGVTNPKGFKCDSGDIYNYDYCGNRQGMKTDCSAAGCTGIVCNDCTPGAVACNGDNTITCNASGKWGPATACANPCLKCNPSTGGCAVSITTNTVCNNNDLYYATFCGTPSGFIAKDCGALGCTNGANICNVCSNGDYECSSSTEQRQCNNGVWQSPTTCGASAPTSCGSYDSCNLTQRCMSQKVYTPYCTANSCFNQLAYNTVKYKL
jgi:hypothetical protein